MVVVNASSLAPALTGPFSVDAIELVEDVGNALQEMVVDGVLPPQAIQAASDAGLPAYWRIAAYILVAEAGRRPSTLDTIRSDAKAYGDKLGTLAAGAYQGSRPAFGDDATGVQKALAGLLTKDPSKIVSGYVAAIINNAGDDSLKRISVEPSGAKPTPPLIGISGGTAVLIGLGILTVAAATGLYIASKQ